ncbi:MAG: SufD family Fe-S cluster assembly protein, partial [Novosphingobium sp.]
MSQALALPTRKDEDFRYADLAALAPLWPVAVETISVAAGEAGNLAMVLDGGEPVAREIAIVLGDGASFDLRLLNAPSAYGRVAVKVKLGRGASFTLGAAQLAGGDQVVEIVTDVLHAQPDAVSRQVVRSVAGGQATANY